MKQSLLALGGAIGLATAALGSASASCGLEGGYMYTYLTCVGGSTPCRDARFSDNHHVMIVSNVFFDDGRNSVYPHSVFFDELRIQAGLSANGRQSNCYRSAAEAERAQRDHIADYMRNMRQTQVFRISMPNT